jgi:hypothetical protein
VHMTLAPEPRVCPLSLSTSCRNAAPLTASLSLSSACTCNMRLVHMTLAPEPRVCPLSLSTSCRNAAPLTASLSLAPLPAAGGVSAWTRPWARAPLFCHPPPPRLLPPCPISVTQRALSVTQRALSVTQRALSDNQRAHSVTQRALSVTQRALSVTQRALSDNQRAHSVTTQEAYRHCGCLLARHPLRRPSRRRTRVVWRSRVVLTSRRQIRSPCLLCLQVDVRAPAQTARRRQRIQGLCRQPTRRSAIGSGPLFPPACKLISVGQHIATVVRRLGGRVGCSSEMRKYPA